MNLRITPANLRTAFAAVVVAATMQLSQSRDVFVDYTRPMVLQTLRWCGNEAVDCGEELRVGNLQVPWTRDCAGINLLLILLALAVWVNRKETRAWRFWLCLAGMVPAAAVANVLRVLTLLAYRTLAYPGVESPQTHYFVGFIWLVPFITLITPRDQRQLAAGLMEALHAAAVVALLAPLAGTPNATLLTLAAVIGLAQCRMREDRTRVRSWWMAGWVAAGTGIAVVGMESFWLPWLLLCPLLVQARWAGSVPGVACLICTHSVVVMQPWSWAIAGVGMAWAYCWGEGVEGAAAIDAAPPAPVRAWPVAWAGIAAFCACLTLPFLASTVLAIGQESWQPPASVESRCISPNCFEVHLRGQPEHIGLVCYSAASRDRHHTLTVCLKYRGVELTSVADSPLVLTDGTNWFREFFLQNGKLLPDYPAYVQSTFIPWSEPGVHLIFVAANGVQKPGEFSAACEELAKQFHQQCQPEERMAGLHYAARGMGLSFSAQTRTE